MEVLILQSFGGSSSTSSSEPMVKIYQCGGIAHHQWSSLLGTRLFKRNKSPKSDLLIHSKVQWRSMKRPSSWCSSSVDSSSSSSSFLASQDGVLIASKSPCFLRRILHGGLRRLFGEIINQSLGFNMIFINNKTFLHACLICNKQIKYFFVTIMKNIKWI